MFYSPGAEALSHFRIERLLAEICYVVPQVTELYAEYIHFIDSEDKLTIAENDILESLLNYSCTKLNYGYTKDKNSHPISGQTSNPAGQVPIQTYNHASNPTSCNTTTTPSQTSPSPQSHSGTFLLVIPRSGTVSPWSSKATDIAHHSTLQKIRRIERGIGYYIETSEKITWGDLQAIADILHDRMTESVIYDLDAASILFQSPPPKPIKIIPLLESELALQHPNLQVLDEINIRWGLALSQEELQYLASSFQKLNRNPTDAELMIFAQFNSEHCRHKIFNAQWVIDGVFKSQSLFSMIKNSYEKNSRGILSAYTDHAAIIAGGEAAWLQCDPYSQVYEVHQEPIHCVLKVETHNHPTGISPFPGAATGVGSEIRDEAATGRGAKTKAGMVGFCVSNLEIPGFTQAWEIPYGRPKRLASALNIMLEAPLGSAQYSNEFGRPTLLGFFRTFEQSCKSQKNNADCRGYHKPLMISGGIGSIRDINVAKAKTSPENLIIVLGGPAMLVGVGGSAAASLISGSLEETLDFASVQRGNAEMQRRCQEVINTCASLGKDNPMLMLHDMGPGGIANAVSELMLQHHQGAHLELRDIPSADPGMSPLELLCNEEQERYILIVAKEQFEIFEHIAKRESCPAAVIGHFIENLKLECFDALNHNPLNEDAISNAMPVNLSSDLLFGNVPRQRKQTDHLPHRLLPFDVLSLDIEEIAYRLLRLPCIADKSFLITINDRSVTGLVQRDSMVGPWQVPVADCAVTARDFTGYQGEAMAVGERPLLSLLNSKASARIAVAEAITNIAAACIGVLSDLRLSANWMAACGYEDEDAKLYDAVKAIGMELCPALNIAIPAGKDSLSMQTVWQEGKETKRVVAPLSLVITAFAPVMDIRRTLTPELRKDCGDTQLIFIDLARGQTRLGGSALAQVYDSLGDDCPDVEDPSLLKGFFSAIQQLNLEDKILAYHDRSDGGLFVTLCEMAFASHTGLQVDLTLLGTLPQAILFNEELGAVIQVQSRDVDNVLLQLNDMGLNDCYVIGSLEESDQIIFIYDEQVVFRRNRIELEKAWSETSYHMRALRENPRSAKKQYESINDKEDPGLNASLTFNIDENINTTLDFIQVIEKPRVAILREQGTNGHHEMAAAFHAAGFTAIDIHMNDLVNDPLNDPTNNRAAATRVRQNLETISGLAICGGSSYGDALGTGQGWAKRILHQEDLRNQFETFFRKTHTFTLGIGNGCQMLTGLKAIIPGAEHWPVFLRNYSDQFEGRLCLVEIEPSPSMLFTGMEGSKIPVVVAHAEGRAEFPDDMQDYALKNRLITLRYVDSRGRKTNIYPSNPNGSPLGITGLTTQDGRINIMMPHPERGFRTVQFSWHPKEWGEEGPWLRMFRNARRWVG